MKARVIESGDIVLVDKHWEDYGSSVFVGYIDGDGNLYKRTELEILPEPAPKKIAIDGWIATDYDGPTCVYKEKPTRKSYIFWYDEHYIFVPKGWFPDVTWESEPRKVHLEITLLDNENEK